MTKVKELSPAPALELNFEPIITKVLDAKIIDLIQYIGYKKQLKEINLEQITTAKEQVLAYTEPVQTIRYNGEIWLHIFTKGKTTIEGYKFESPFIK